MSLGSQIGHQPRMFQTAIEATEGRGVQLVLSAGALAEQLDHQSGEHVLARAYVPQLSLLEHSEVMITHGGANSVMEALHFGVPLLISPIVNDQHHQARFIEAAQVGERLDLQKASPAQLWAALQRLLQRPPGIERMKRAYQASGGARAAAMIEALVHRQEAPDGR